MNRITRGEAIVSSGVGQHQMWAAQYCDFREPRLWLTSGSMGTMGFGLPAAIGAQIAHPGKLVIDVDGDASIRMRSRRARRPSPPYDLPIKIIVLNNFGDGMVSAVAAPVLQGPLVGERQVAAQEGLREDGASRRLRLRRSGSITKRDVPRVLEEFINFGGAGVPRGHHRSRRPACIPWSGPGLSYQEMITGDFIPNRYEDLGKPQPPDKSEMF